MIKFISSIYYLNVMEMKQEYIDLFEYIENEQYKHWRQKSHYFKQYEIVGLSLIGTDYHVTEVFFKNKRDDNFKLSKAHFSFERQTIRSNKFKSIYQKLLDEVKKDFQVINGSYNIVYLSKECLDLPTKVEYDYENDSLSVTIANRIHFLFYSISIKQLNLFTNLTFSKSLLSGKNTKIEKQQTEIGRDIKRLLNEKKRLKNRLKTIEDTIGVYEEKLENEQTVKIPIFEETREKIKETLGEDIWAAHILKYEIERL